MARRSLPTSDSGLLAWSLNFKMRIAATPADFGLTPALAAAYATLHDSYATAMAACEPAIRSQVATAIKNDARTALRTNARVLMNIIAGKAGVTESQKIDLGFALRRTASPIPAPTAAPAISILLVTGWTVKVRLRDIDSRSKRGKPAGVIGASLFSFVGETPPADLGAWKFQDITGRTRLDVAFPSTLAPGTKVWLIAFWFNGRKQGGPASTPVSTQLQGGTVSLAA